VRSLPYAGGFFYFGEFALLIKVDSGQTMGQWTVLKPLQLMLRQMGGALLFYTILPLPARWSLDFSRVARWATWMGLLIGTVLWGINALLQQLPLSPGLRSVLVVALWIGLTGGLHLDGVMDTADGLAVPDPERRLSVMSDSRTGAYGVMAALILILLKVEVIATLTGAQTYSLLLAPIWGRWGQLLAIVRYPYLKVEGKGAFHRQNLQLPQDFWPSILLLMGLVFSTGLLQSQPWLMILLTTSCGLFLAWIVGAWFYWQLRGMTGDSYGAIVEWTEVFVLCGLSFLTKQSY
jgi:adenosylcobinamide-GDP ribazoletransferase